MGLAGRRGGGKAGDKQGVGEESKRDTKTFR